MPGTGQTLSFRNQLSVADGFGRVQWTTQFFLTADCSGSLYAAYVFPARSSQYVGQRAVNLPDTSETVMGTLHLGQSASAPLQIYGAAMQLPNNTAMVGIVVNGVQTFISPVGQNVSEGRLLLYATRGGLYLTANGEPGAVVDSQGFPMRFLHGMQMVRVQ